MHKGEAITINGLAPLAEGLHRKLHDSGGVSASWDASERK